MSREWGVVKPTAFQIPEIGFSTSSLTAHYSLLTSHHSLLSPKLKRFRKPEHKESNEEEICPHYNTVYLFKFPFF